MNVEDFIVKARKIHGDRYDYSKSVYKNYGTKLVIICKIHGEFEQTPAQHIIGRGCQKCSGNMRSNIEEFIKKARVIHGDKYDYSRSIYVGRSSQIKIICPIHGEFEQKVGNHLMGKGCNKCNIDNRKVSVTEFVTRAKAIHGDKYDYSKVKFNSMEDKIIIICSIHGEFEQNAHGHLNGYGCFKCYGSVKSDTEEFVEKARKIHGDKYDYSKVDYKNSKSNVKIICYKHGEFTQRASGHLGGKGCSKCGHSISNHEEFVAKARKIHGDKYDYSEVDFTSYKNKVAIICPVHGKFFQTPNTHFRKSGCINCSKHRKSDTEEFILKSLKVHNDEYDYSKVNYINAVTKVKIICKIHGEFEQIPASHLNGCGCPKCPSNISNGQNELMDFVKSVYDGEIIINDRNIIKPYELDVFIPQKSLAIEYHGIYWHSSRSIDIDESHYNKTDLCNYINVRLIQIFENEWRDKKEIVKSIIKSKIGINNRIYARECLIKELTSKEFNNFCVSNHIQGKLNSLVKLGLIFEDKLVCVIGFNKHKKYDYECTRFCNILNSNVVGGAGKLFNYFIKKYNPKSILSYADRRYSDGGLYNKLGMELVDVTKPGYFYVKNKKVFSRLQFQKHKLKDKLENFNQNLSESQNMFNNGYRRIWDAGHFKFILVNKSC